MIYSIGYAGWEPSALYQLVLDRNALLLDIRYSPHSKRPTWERTSMRAELGLRYRHEPALGNRNYRGDGPIVLAAPERAVAGVAAALAHGPVILLCGCRAHQSCHRTVAADYLAAAIGCAVEHLYPVVVVGASLPAWASDPASAARAYWREEVRRGSAALERLSRMAAERGWSYGALLEVLR